MGKILVVDPIAEVGQSILRSAGFQIINPDEKTPERLTQLVKDVDGIIVRTTKIPASVIDAGKNLKVIGRHGAGVDNIDLDAAARNKVMVINTPNANTLSVVEYVFCAMLVLAKGFVESDKNVRKGSWSFRNIFQPLELNGKTLGVLGYGAIGRELAARAVNGFDMNVIYYDPFVQNCISEPRIRIAKNLTELLEVSDFVSVHVPLTDNTHSMINSDKLNLMKKTAYLINAARGPVVVLNDLYKALKNRDIAGACIDVYDAEPPDNSHPIFELDNIIFTPHNAALTDMALFRAAQTVAEEVITCLKGEKPRYRII